ncbi:MAG: hypothetical protein AAFX92_06205 [Pseudomonadota bacterium]
MSITTVTPPAGFPVTLQEVKRRLNIEAPEADEDLLFLIGAGVEAVEGMTWRPMVQRTVEWTHDRFPAWFVPPLHPVQSVDDITYLDEAGAQQTLAADQYRFSAGGDRGPARITPSYNVAWPATYPVVDAVTVRMTVGWAADGSDLGANVWRDLKLGLIALVGHWHRLRTPVNVGNIVNEIPHYLELSLKANRLQV